MGDVALPALEAGEQVTAAPVVLRFDDIGSVAAYLRTNLDWLADRERHVGAGASVAAEVSVMRSVVGARAQVVGRGVLTRCVVWPGARAEAPLTDAVVTSAGRVVTSV